MLRRRSDSTRADLEYRLICCGLLPYMARDWIQAWEAYSGEAGQRDASDWNRGFVWIQERRAEAGPQRRPHVS
jgi:hypothetical protein